MSVMTRTSTTNRAAGSSGFTLVELLAVMLILAILMTLVIGASKLIFSDVYVEETKAHMKVIMAAIRVYRDAKGQYPSSQATLVSDLTSVAKSRSLIGNLGENVWSPSNKDEFLDAWGKPIKYSPSGGLAGTPGLTSAGPDGDIATEEDNVRYNK